MKPPDIAPPFYLETNIYLKSFVYLALIKHLNADVDGKEQGWNYAKNCIKN